MGHPDLRGPSVDSEGLPRPSLVSSALVGPGTGREGYGCEWNSGKSGREGCSGITRFLTLRAGLTPPGRGLKIIVCSR